MTTYRATRQTAVYQEPSKHAAQVAWIFLRQEFRGQAYNSRWVAVVVDGQPAGYVKASAVVPLAERTV